MTGKPSARQLQRFRIVCHVDIGDQAAFSQVVEEVAAAAYSGREIIHLNAAFGAQEMVFYVAVTAFDPLAGQGHALAAVRGALRSASIGLLEPARLQDVRVEPLVRERLERGAERDQRMDEAAAVTG